MHPKEDACRGSLLYERLETFSSHDVVKYFGINIKDFLELPTDVCNMILELSLKRKKQEGNATEAVLQQLRQEETKTK